MNPLQCAIAAVLRSNSDRITSIWLDDKEKRNISFLEAKKLIETFTNNLFGLASKSNDQPKIGLLMETNELLPLLEISILYANMVIIPMSPNDPVNRLLSIIEDSSPTIIIVDSKNKDKLNGHNIIELNKLKLEHSSTKDSKITTGNISHIFYTSGSTGKPKGCIVSADSLLIYCLGKNQLFSIDSTSTVFVASTPTFDPSMGDYISAWLAGATIAIAKQQFVFNNLFQCLKLSKATHILCTPSLFSTIPKDITPICLPELKNISLGGERMTSTIVDTWGNTPGLILANIYGVTECCVYQSYSPISDNKKYFYLGDAFPNCKIHVITRSKKHPFPTLVTSLEEIGEIWIGGDQVGLGYLNMHELTAEKFVDLPRFGRCFRTGDLAKLQENGKYELIGRIDSQIKLRGNRIEVKEIEAILMKEANPAFINAAAVVLNKKEKCLIAWCIPSSPLVKGSVIPDILRTILKRHLPVYMIPSRFCFTNELPVTNTGKLGYRVLAEWPLENTILETNDTENEEGCALSQGWETLVARVWSSKLGFSITSRNTDFIEVSGDSLVALQCCRELTKELPEVAAINAGEFGENLGALAPVELMQRPKLYEYAEFLHHTFGDIVNESESASPVETSQPLSLIHKAAAVADNVSLEYLLNHRDLCESPSQLGKSPLHLAVGNGNITSVELLLHHSASIISADQNGVTPLHVLAQKGPVELLKLIIPQIGSSLYTKDNNGQTVLHHAARAGAPTRVLEQLIDLWTASSDKKKRLATASIDVPDIWKRTPLHWAVVNGHRNLVVCLVDAGANVKLRDEKNETPLEIAERRARCGAQERGNGVRASVFGDIATLLGGSGSTKNLKNKGFYEN